MLKSHSWLCLGIIPDSIQGPYVVQGDGTLVSHVQGKCLPYTISLDTKTSFHTYVWSSNHRLYSRPHLLLSNDLN